MFLIHYVLQLDLDLELERSSASMREIQAVFLHNKTTLPLNDLLCFLMFLITRLYLKSSIQLCIFQICSNYSHIIMFKSQYQKYGFATG